MRAGSPTLFGCSDGFGKVFVQISDDGACLVNCEITMLQDWHAVEGMQRQMAWLAHLRLQIMERVWHLLVREDCTMLTKVLRGKPYTMSSVTLPS